MIVPIDIEIDISNEVHIVPRDEDGDFQGDYHYLENRIDRIEETDFVEDFMEFFLENSCIGCQPTDSLQSILKSPSDWILGKPIDVDSIDDDSSCRSVSFKEVEIREFPMTLGDHPSATSGPPVRLDYSHERKTGKNLDLDEYEQVREPRRSRRELKLSLSQRHHILVQERGYSYQEITGAWKEALDIRRKRIETLQQSYLKQTWNNWCETIGILWLRAL